MKVSEQGYISKIETMGMVDGPGIRTILFLSGCPLRCLFCHNPDMWKVHQGELMQVDDLVEKVKRYKPFYSDNGGVTFCGGEPLTQPEFLLALLKACKKEGIHTCLDTSGYGRPETFNEILDYTDLILYDIKAVDPAAYRFMTGQETDITQQFLKLAQEKKIPLWIRAVIVPGINDKESCMKELAEAVKSIHGVEKIELLPYHTLGIPKYEQLGLEYPLKDVEAMDREWCEKRTKILNQLINKVS